MNSYQITSFGQPLELHCYEEPVPAGTEIVVRITDCGVCHSDLHVWSGFFDLGGGRRINMADRGLKLPFTMGHEIVGEVVAVGPDARDVAVGTRGIVYPWIGDGTCPICLSGHELQCPNPRTLGTRRNGGYSDRVIVPHPRYIVPYGNLDPALAATCACSGLTAWGALKKLPEMSADDTVVIVGAGGVGLAAVGLAAGLTPARIVVADISADKREAALAAGAAVALDPKAADAKALMVAGRSKPPLAAIDFVGSPETLQFALGQVGVGATVVVVGLFGGEMPISTALLPLRQLTLKGSYVGTLAELKELVAHMQAQRVTTVPITRRPMAEVNAILHDLEGGRILGRVVMNA